MENSGRRNRIYIIAAAVVLLGAAFLSGAWYGYENRPGVEKVLNVTGQKPPPEFENVDFNLFWEVWSKLEEKYVDRGNIDRQALVFGAIEGLTGALGDPYTEFLSPAESKQFQEDIRGSFEGIGAEIGIRRGVLTIIAPLKDSPAERAGLKAGDKILQVDDTATSDLTLDEAVRLIRGPKGTPVRLAILRDTADRTREISVVRDTIKIQVLTTERLQDGIFVIKLHSFSQTAPAEFRRALQEFYDSDSRKIVFDLRNNPGGFLSVAVDIASWWLPAGEIVARERFADNEEDLYRSNGYQILRQVPTVVLVNQGSASASEIVAGALRDHLGIQLVGAKTFGKGSVQEVENLPKGSSLKVTIAKWLTPNGTEINGKGLEPDVVVELPEPDENGEVEEERDLILERGIEILKGL